MAAAAAEALWRRRTGTAAASSELQQLDRLMDRHLRDGARPEALFVDLRTASPHEVTALDAVFDAVVSGLLKQDPALRAAAPAFMAGHDATWRHDGTSGSHSATLRMLKATGARFAPEDSAPAAGRAASPMVACGQRARLPFCWWSTAVALAVLQARWTHVIERGAQPGSPPVL